MILVPKPIATHADPNNPLAPPAIGTGSDEVPTANRWAVFLRVLLRALSAWTV
jgi:hypothetical protein